MTLVAMSAAYGAGGSQVGPAVARALGVQFVDRAIPAAVASALDVSLEEASRFDDRAATGFLVRLLGSFRATGTYAPVPVPDQGPFAEDFRQATERALREQAAGGAAVILGRASTIVLADDPRVLRVRLDGPRERRLEQAMRIGGVDRATAERQMRQFDGAHGAYAMKFYRARMDDPTRFHLLLDSTAIALADCAELIAGAARAFAVSARV